MDKNLIFFKPANVLRDAGMTAYEADTSTRIGHPPNVSWCLSDDDYVKKLLSEEDPMDQTCFDESTDLKCCYDQRSL